MNHHDNSLNNSRNNKGKDNNFIEQEKRIFQELHKTPSTMKEVSVRTNIDRANICRYISHFRKRNAVCKTKRVVCSITKRWVWQLSTNPELFGNTGTQTNLF